MATPSKAQYLADIQALLKKRYKPSPSAPKLSVFEAVVYGICHEDATRTQADAAMEAFRTGFFDWNEVRVSPIVEIQGVFAKLGMPDAEDRAGRLRRFLRQLFEKSYGFDLEPLTKKPLKDATKSLQEFEAPSRDFVLATIIRLGLGGHAIGIDRPTRRALERLGLAESGQDDASLRATLERAVPKAKGTEFVDLIEDLAHDTCVEGEPDCPRCELKKVCPSSRTRKPAPPGAKAGARPTSAAQTATRQGAPASPPPPSAKGKAPAPAKASAPRTRPAAKPAKSAPAKAPSPAKVATPAKAVTPASSKAKPAVKAPAPASATKVVAKSARAAHPASPKAAKGGKPGRAK